MYKLLSSPNLERRLKKKYKKKLKSYYIQKFLMIIDIHEKNELHKR